MIGLERPCQFVGHGGHLVGCLAPVEGRIEVDAFRPARDRHRVEVHVFEDPLREARHFGAVLERRSFAGIEVEHQPVRILAPAAAGDAPLRHVDLECGDLREPDQRRAIVDERVVVGARLVRDRASLHPRRRGGVVQILLEEHVARLVRCPHSVHPPLAGRDPVADVGDHHLRHRVVVADDVGLGGSRLGIQHLVEVGQLESVAVEFDDFAVRGGHASKLLPGPRTSITG